LVGDQVIYRSKLIYRPIWSKNDIHGSYNLGKVNVNTKTYFGWIHCRRMVLGILKQRKKILIRLGLTLRNKKYDFACSVCGRDLSLHWKIETYFLLIMKK
jgi:hypothetical protein